MKPLPINNEKKSKKSSKDFNNDKLGLYLSFKSSKFWLDEWVIL